jgi:hypothetical protein
MMRIIGIALALCFAMVTLPAMALTKAEAMTCVNRGIDAFLGGTRISHMIDVPYMIDREHINATEKKLRSLLDQRARENLGYYRNVTATVVGQPQPKKNDFFLVAGAIKGEETQKLDPVEWKTFSYHYVLWIRKERNHCLIGVLTIEEIFRLAGWVKNNL